MGTNAKRPRSIIRVEKGRDNPYTMIPRAIFEDERLSLDTRGLLGYLLVKPDDWQIWNTDLERTGHMGESKLARILSELKRFGYMTRERGHDERGRIIWITVIHESPVAVSEPYPDYPGMGQPSMVEPSMGQPSMDNQGIYQELTSPNTNVTNNERENERALSGIAGTFDDSPIHRTLTSMSDTATGDISRNSSIPCADTVIATVKVDPFDSLPSARPSIVNGRPVHRGGKQTPPAMRDPSFEPTVQAIKAGYPLRDGAGPTEKEIRRALALVEPIHYGAIVAALPVYAKCKDVREGVVRNITTWLEDERWEAYQPKAAPVVSRAPSAVDEIARRRAARAQQGS